MRQTVNEYVKCTLPKMGILIVSVICSLLCISVLNLPLCDIILSLLFSVNYCHTKNVATGLFPEIAVTWDVCVCLCVCVVCIYMYIYTHTCTPLHRRNAWSSYVFIRPKGFLLPYLYLSFDLVG